MSTPSPADASLALRVPPPPPASTISPLVTVAAGSADPSAAAAAPSAAAAPLAAAGSSEALAAKPDPHAHLAPGDFPARRWIVLAISCVGVFLASVSTSALIIAFPKLIIELETTMNTMMWVLLVVLLMIACVTPIAGKLGDVFGQANLYKFGYWVFLLGSLGGGLCDKANKGLDLIAARIFIGLGGAFLFTNSMAILTTAFVPYNQVGLSQGCFQLTAALGTVLGPLVGGGLAETNWRWIFFFNLPLGVPLATLALLYVRDNTPPSKRTYAESFARFDKLGAVSCVLGLILLLLAMIQAVAPSNGLNDSGPLAGLVVGGCASGTIFIVSQFYAVDALIPPRIFLNKTFFYTTAAGTLMAFIRNSITYNMIFFLQGPFGEDPLAAGIALIPFGIGIMIAGFLSGALADKVGVRNMAMAGPMFVLAACIGLSQLNKQSSAGGIGGLLFFAGFGVGLFQSPNGMANMLSVLPNQRGVAASISMLTMMFCSMVGIVITFSFVLNSMSQADLFILFIYGGGALPDSAVKLCLDALAKDYFILFAACIGASLCASQIPGDFSAKKSAATAATTAPLAAPSATAPSEAAAQLADKAADAAADCKDTAAKVAVAEAAAQLDPVAAPAAEGGAAAGGGDPREAEAAV